MKQFAKLVTQVLAWGWVGLAMADPSLRGTLYTDGVTGRSTVGHGWVEEKIYVSPAKPGEGVGLQTAAQPHGRFELPPKSGPVLAPGAYELFALCYDGIPAFSFKSDVRLGADGAVDADLRTPAHYSVMFNKGHDEWGKSPWVQADNFYQMFIATSRHVTRVATKLADKSGDHQTLYLNYAIYQCNQGPPSTWKQISPVRTRFMSSGTDPIIHIFHVRFRSNEVELTPGKMYAIRLWRGEKSGSQKFSLVVRPDKGDNYGDGWLWIGDEQRRDLDAYAYISGGEPGTVVNFAPVEDPLPVSDTARSPEAKKDKLIGSAKRFGQTFTATGTGLAAVDVIYTTGVVNPPAAPFTFQLYDKPGGKPIGSARTCYGIPLAFQGRAAVAWPIGDVPLTPGKTYYIEWTCPTEVNTWIMNEDLPGEAYRNGTAVPEADLMMSIVEFEPASPATRPVQ